MAGGSLDDLYVNVIKWCDNDMQFYTKMGGGSSSRIRRRMIYFALIDLLCLKNYFLVSNGASGKSVHNFKNPPFNQKIQVLVLYCNVFWLVNYGKNSFVSVCRKISRKKKKI